MNQQQQARRGSKRKKIGLYFHQIFPEGDESPIDIYAMKWMPVLAKRWGDVPASPICQGTSSLPSKLIMIRQPD